MSFWCLFLLTLIRLHMLLWCFHCWLLKSKFRMEWVSSDSSCWNNSLRTFLYFKHYARPTKVKKVRVNNKGRTTRAYSRDWGTWCVLWGHICRKKTFCWLAPPKQMPFLTISNENFFKTQDTSLGAIVAPNKGLQWTLTTPSTDIVSVYPLLTLNIVKIYHLLWQFVYES